jgi:hypothetical protein
MASTRNRNTSGNYELEQWSNNNGCKYNTYDSFGRPKKTLFAGDGLLNGKVGPTELAHNSCDIESMLRGIGSTNLVNPNPEIVPEIRPLQSLSIIDRLHVAVPDPLVVEPNQRPGRYLN